MRRFIITFSLFLAAQYGLRADLINVPGNYSQIQSAINASTNGDTILVEPGTYFENINFRGKRIVLTSRYYLTNDPATIWSTVINGSTPVQPDSGSCVIVNNNEDSTTVLQGFTLTGGNGTKWQDEHGAGRYREGGAILIQYSSPVIQYNIIHNNLITDLSGVVSTGGGGIRVGDSYPRIYNNIIMDNTARYGAGVVLNFTGGEVKNNVICVNYGSNQYGSGSGIWLNGSFQRPTYIFNNTIASNSSLSGYPGIYGFGSVSAFIFNNIIWGNTSTATVQIGGGNFTIRYCDVQGGYSGAGNINVNPQFADSNYYLLPSSPCVDAGDSSIIYNDPEDPNNPGNALWPARGTLRNDMGAYGGPLSKVLSNILIGLKKISGPVPQKFQLFQNYPNPFNPATKIKFDIGGLDNNGVLNAKITVFDIQGKQIAVIFNRELQAGTYEIEWNATDYPAGVYFYRFTAGDLSVSRKMILLK